MAEVDALADSVFKAVESYLARSLEDFTKRMDAVITARIEALPKAKDGEPGKDADISKLVSVVGPLERMADDALAKIGALEKQVAELPTPQDGTPGKDAVVDYEKIAEDIAKAIGELPKPKDGENGAAGLPGKDAVIDYALVTREIDTRVKDAVALIPVPRDGEKGKDADPQLVRSLVTETVAASVAEAVTALPIPKDGEPGPRGEAGPSGEPGKDAVLDYDKINEAIQENFEEVVKELPKSPTSFMIDDAGELVSIYADGTFKTIGVVRGKDGARGSTVANARIDDAGLLILKMTDQRDIICGGVRGKDGKDGISVPGKPGRDANEVRPVPAIDESKSYPEGTYAEYRGGEIRAERTTDPIIDGDVLKAGWRIAREGIAEETEQTIDDGRIIECTTVYTSGRSFVRRRQTNSIIYKGVWKEGDFVPGDVVTWDGGMWHCERATKERPGGLTGVGDWKLCVKRGSPGKDASNGTKH